MTIEQLKQHPLYAQLTEKQQAYVDARCSGQGELEAVKATHSVASDEAANTQIYRLRRHPKVTALLNAYFEYDETYEQFDKSEFLTYLARAIRDEKNGGSTRTKLMQLYAELKGWSEGIAEPSSPGEDEVQKLVIAMEGKK